MFVVIAQNQAGFDGVKTVQRSTPSACLDHPNSTHTLQPNQLVNYANPPIAKGFHGTFAVQARRINVFAKSNMVSQGDSTTSNERRYCSSLNGK